MCGSECSGTQGILYQTPVCISSWTTSRNNQQISSAGSFSLLTNANAVSFSRANTRSFHFRNSPTNFHELFTPVQHCVRVFSTATWHHHSGCTSSSNHDFHKSMHTLIHCKATLECQWSWAPCTGTFSLKNSTNKQCWTYYISAVVYWDWQGKCNFRYHCEGYVHHILFQLFRFLYKNEICVGLRVFSITTASTSAWSRLKKTKRNHILRAQLPVQRYSTRQQKVVFLLENGLSNQGEIFRSNH